MALLPLREGEAALVWCVNSADDPVAELDDAQRLAVLRTIVPAEAGQAALVLSGLDPDPDWTVRAVMAGALGEAGDEVSVGILLSMLKDEDVRVLPAVLEAIRKTRGNDAVDTLLRHLEHPDFAVRAAAACCHSCCSRVPTRAN